MSGAREQYEARLDHLFGEAERLTHLDARDVLAKASANGSLRSGATLKQLVRAIEARSQDAVSAALSGLDQRPLRESTRQRLREILKSRTRTHLAGPVRGLPKTGSKDEAAATAVEALIVEAEARLIAHVDQHATGFLPSSQVSWVQAHPTLAFAITTVASAVAIVISIASLVLKD